MNCRQLGSYKNHPRELQKRRNLVDDAMEKTFGQKMQAWRERANISQAELARRMDVSRNYISTLERDFSSSAKGGKPQPSVETCDKIARALGLKIGEVRLAAGYATPTNGAETVSNERATRLGELVEIFSVLPSDRQLLAVAIIKLLKSESTADTPNSDQFPENEDPDEFTATLYEPKEPVGPIDPITPHRKGGRS